MAPAGAIFKLGSMLKKNLLTEMFFPPPLKVSGHTGPIRSVFKFCRSYAARKEQRCNLPESLLRVTFQDFPLAGSIWNRKKCGNRLAALV